MTSFAPDRSPSPLPQPKAPQYQESASQATNPRVDQTPVEAQYRTYHSEIRNLRVGEQFEAPSGRLFERGRDGNIYFNSQGTGDRTFGKLVNGIEQDKDQQNLIYIKTDANEFIKTAGRVAGLSMNAAFSVSEDNKRVFDGKGNELHADQNGVYAVRNYNHKSGNDHVKLIGSEWRAVSDAGTTQLPAVIGNDPSVDRTPTEAQYRSYQKEIDSLLVGDRFQSPTGRLYERGKDGNIYFNSQGNNDRTFGLLINGIEQDKERPEVNYVRSAENEFIKTTRKSTGTALAADYNVSEDNKRVFDGRGNEVTPDAIGIYSIPNYNSRAPGTHIRFVGGDWTVLKQIGALDFSKLLDAVSPA